MGAVMFGCPQFFMLRSTAGRRESNNVGAGFALADWVAVQCDGQSGDAMGRVAMRRAEWRSIGQSSGALGRVAVC